MNYYTKPQIHIKCGSIVAGNGDETRVYGYIESLTMSGGWDNIGDARAISECEAEMQEAIVDILSKYAKKRMEELDAEGAGSDSGAGDGPGGPGDVRP